MTSSGSIVGSIVYFFLLKVGNSITNFKEKKRKKITRNLSHRSTGLLFSIYERSMSLENNVMSHKSVTWIWLGIRKSLWIYWIDSRLQHIKGKNIIQMLGVNTTSLMFLFLCARMLLNAISLSFYSLVIEYFRVCCTLKPIYLNLSSLLVTVCSN